jgi:c-di-GMP-binding flagellar brake protein YcgR
MLKIFRRFWQPKERRRYGRISAHSDVRFRIIDSKNTAIRSQLLQGKVLDLSAEGLCIGTTTVQADWLHVFHPSSQYKNRLEVEVDLDPCMAPLRTFGEAKWYSRDKNEKGSIFKIGVKWLSLSESARQTLNNFLETQAI